MVKLTERLVKSFNTFLFSITIILVGFFPSTGSGDNETLKNLPPGTILKLNTDIIIPANEQYIRVVPSTIVFTFHVKPTYIRRIMNKGNTFTVNSVESDNNLFIYEMYVNNHSMNKIVISNLEKEISLEFFIEENGLFDVDISKTEDFFKLDK